MTTFEMLGREKKVARLVGLFCILRVHSQRVRDLSPGDWEAIAEFAKVKPPSAETVQCVLAQLEQMGRPAVPFTDADAAADGAYSR